MRNVLLASLVVLAAFCCSHPSSSGSNLSQGDTLQARLVHAKPDWQNLDLHQDDLFGISTNSAYAELLNNKKATTVIVAVIDSGIDTAQEDLRSVLWTDPKDGSHGRNYIASETGKEDFIPLLMAKTNDREYSKTQGDYHLHVSRLEAFLSQLKESKRVLERILQKMGKENPTPGELTQYHPRDEDERRVMNLVLDRLPAYPDFASLKFYELDHLLELGQYHLAHGLKIGTAHDDHVGAGINTDISNDALGLTPDPNVTTDHGTMESGIIAAVRNNGKGINGVADHARIMMLKLFNNIREMRNDDLAVAIRYAVDHEARIINMSFGKTFSLHREVVDSAVQYAMSRGLLLVHSAGNNGMDLDVDSNSFFPSPRYLGGGVAPAWLEVGASGYRNDSTLAASFSNYGHQRVDVFAPGVQVTSTAPHSRLSTWDGTSEAAPVVAGLAALIWAYYPHLTAVQVKEIIMQSVVKTTWLKDKCVSGGVVNAFNALKLAADYK